MADSRAELVAEEGTVGKVVVKKYKGEHALESGIEHMAKRGYAVQSQGSRKKLFSITTGFFTRKQIHTVVFVRA